MDNKRIRMYFSYCPPSVSNIFFRVVIVFNERESFVQANRSVMAHNHSQKSDTIIIVALLLSLELPTVIKIAL